jgi:hypothetical protein
MFIRYKLYGIKGLSRLEAAPTLGNKIIQLVGAASSRD